MPAPIRDEPEISPIEVSVDAPDRLFHELDPSPLVGRDLDVQVENYILSSAREMRSERCALVLHVPQQMMPSNAEGEALCDAIRTYFAYRRDEEARKLRSLMREGRQSAAIGLAFLFVCGALGLLAVRAFPAPLGSFLNEGLLIIGWVANWRPLEIFLYDWRPIRREWRILDGLSRMPIEFALRSGRRPLQGGAAAQP